MSDSCVVYVNEALYYYFSFIFIYFLLFSLFIFFTVLRSVLLTWLLHNKSAYNLSDSYIYLNPTNQASISVKLLFLYVFH